MKINKDKYSLFIRKLLELEQQFIAKLIDTQGLGFRLRYKIFWFHPKANGYFKNDWLCLVAKIEKG